ncbi:MAG: hypothetical protein K2K31_02830, partial [Clostridia bacterium]|nr:hypothetical protein [Clostridia bacterium]
MLMLIPVILSLVGTIILIVLGCFYKSSPVSLLLKSLSLIGTLALALSCAIYEGTFYGYSIFLILAVAPQFLSLINLKEIFKPKQDDASKEEKEEPKKHSLISSDNNLMNGAAIFLTAICLGFCALYLGKETAYGFLIGVGVGLTVTFLLLALKRISNLFDIASCFLMFTGAGIAFGHIISVLVYAFTLTNIMFAIGALIYVVYVALTYFWKNNYSQIAYFLSMFVFFATLII